MIKFWQTLDYLNEFSSSIGHGEGAGVKSRRGSKEKQLCHLMQTTAGIKKN